MTSSMQQQKVYVYKLNIILVQVSRCMLDNVHLFFYRSLPPYVYVHPCYYTACSVCVCVWWELCHVQIVKQEWPRNWTTFVSDIVGASKTSESLCTNNMAILRLLRSPLIPVHHYLAYFYVACRHVRIYILTLPSFLLKTVGCKLPLLYMFPLPYFDGGNAATSVQYSLYTGLSCTYEHSATQGRKENLRWNTVSHHTFSIRANPYLCTSSIACALHVPSEKYGRCSTGSIWIPRVLESYIQKIYKL